MKSEHGFTLDRIARDLRRLRRLKKAAKEKSDRVRCPNHRSGGATSCPRGGAELQIWQREQWGE